MIKTTDTNNYYCLFLLLRKSENFCLKDDPKEKNPNCYTPNCDVVCSECTSEQQSELTAFIWILNPLRLLPSLHQGDVYDQQTLCLLEFKILAEHILKDTILNLLFQFAM